MRISDNTRLFEAEQTRTREVEAKSAELRESLEHQIATAVIAIENTRLFEEVQARTRDLTDALKYQTATSDVLNVMSRSKFDLQPVLDIIAEGAVRLCAAHQAAVFRYDSELMHLGAMVNMTFAPAARRHGVRSFLDRRPLTRQWAGAYSKKPLSL